MKSLTCFSSRSRGTCCAVILERLAENCRGRTTAIICTRTNAPKYILESHRLHFGSICDQNGRNFEPWLHHSNLPWNNLSYSSERLKHIRKTFTGFIIAQDALWETRAWFDVTLKVLGLARLYFPYKCSMKSFMWFEMQWTNWTNIFKIWTSLTECCFQFQMLTRFVCVRDCLRMRLCISVEVV